MAFSAEERLQIYREAIPNVNKCFGLCRNLNDICSTRGLVSTDIMSFFPELMELKPEKPYSSTFWYAPSEK